MVLISGKLIFGRYSGPEKFAVETIDVPKIGDDDVLVSLKYDAELPTTC